MGSPVSAVIADLVMHVEEQALSSSPVALHWWRRCVYDSNVCLKKVDVDIIHQHLNTINPNIQFTIECASQNGSSQSIAFLDTQVTALSHGSLEVRKKTHMNKYLT